MPWLNQSRVSNCSQAAAITLSVVAGIICGPRASSVRLTTRGLGVMTRLPSSGSVNVKGTLRPNRVPAIPMAGADRSLWAPSGVWATRYRGFVRVSGAGLGDPDRAVAWIEEVDSRACVGAGARELDKTDI